ncbi:MAG: hypothetical protein V4622_00030 [Bacteroidota bacterium]
MKKPLLTLAVVAGLIASISSCETSAKKVENAQENLEESEDKLDEANQEYVAEIEEYRKETADRIEANNKSIAEFNARIDNEKMEAKADYRKRVLELEQKNSDLKKTMDDYKAQGKENWEEFKTEFSDDMNDLGEAIKNVFTK